jgi:hypothetical protein
LHSAPDQLVASARARWLAELGQAVAQAQRLAWLLGIAEGDSEEAGQLYARLESVRTELDTLRTSGWAEVRREIDPSWLEKLLRQGPLPMLGTSDPST